MDSGCPLLKLSHFKIATNTATHSYIEDAIMAPYTFEQLRTASMGHILGPLANSLSDRCHHPDLVSALLWDAILKHFLHLTQVDIC